MKKIIIIVLISILTSCSDYNKDSEPQNESKLCLDVSVDSSSISINEANAQLNMKLSKLDLQFEHIEEFVGVNVSNDRLYYAYLLSEITSERKVGIMHFYVDVFTGEVYNVTNMDDWKKLK